MFTSKKGQMIPGWSHCAVATAPHKQGPAPLCSTTPFWELSLEAPANSQQCLWTPALLITAIAFLVLINFIANSSFPSPFKPCFCVTLEDNVYVFTHQFPVSHMHCSSAFLWVCYFWLYRGNHLPVSCVLQHFVHSRSFSGICISIFYLEVRDQNLLDSDSISENLT